MNPSLTGKRALVTGGSRGIGAAIVKRLARDGADVAFTYVTKPDQAEETARLARESGVKALAIQADSADASSLTGAVDQTVAELGGLDILVSNAGIAVMAPLDAFKLEDLDRTLAANLRAVFVAARAASKHMKAGGRIITIGSCNAERMPFIGGAVYSMSKAGLVGLVKGLARDHGQQHPARPCRYGHEPGRWTFRRDAEGIDGATALRKRRRDCGHGLLPRRT